MLEPQRPLGRDSRNFPTRGEEGGGASATGEGRAGGRDAPGPLPGSPLAAPLCAGARAASLRRAGPAHAHSRASRLAHNEGGGPSRARPPTLPSGPGRRAGGSAWRAEALRGSLSSRPSSGASGRRRAWEGRAGARASSQSPHGLRASPRAKPAPHLYPAEHGHLSTLGETGVLANFGGDFAGDLASRAQVSLEPTELLPLAF